MADYDPDRLLTERAPAGASITVRPAKLARDDLHQLVRKYNPDITEAAIKGEVDNIMRESGGKSAVPGDFNKSGQATSGGLYQHHNTRLTELKSYANKHQRDWTDPEIQVQFSRMEKERDYPSLLKAQQSVTDPAKAEDMFKRIFERPASVLWQNNAQGQPVLGNDRFRFSDYALNEHMNRPGTNIAYMPPGDYLDLSPELSGKPFQNPSGRALMKSFARGDAIEAIPTLDMKVDGNTGTVTDQDGRHRALLAQQEGIDAIPVAIRQQGSGTPTEVQGMSGKLLPNDFVAPKDMPKREAIQQAPTQQREPLSLLERVGTALNPISSAEAAEAPNPYAQFAPKPAADANPYAQFANPSAAQSGPRPNMMEAAARGFSKGFGDTVFAGQELLGKGVQAAGDVGHAGTDLTADARERMAAEAKKAEAAKAAHPLATGIGEFVGGLVMPGGFAVRPARLLGSGAAATGAMQGAAAGMLTPGSQPKPGEEEHFWRDKAAETGLGAGVGGAAGALAGKIGPAVANFISPKMRPNLEKLLSEGVELTPGQMMGGKARRVEDAMTSIPGIGSQIREAQVRSIQTFNRAAINRSLDDIGGKLPPGLNSGHDAIGFAQDAFRDAYDQVIPRMVGKLDRDMLDGLNDIMAKAQRENLPQGLQDELKYTIQQQIIEPFRMRMGQITGTDTQKIGTELDSIINMKRIDKSPYERQAARYLREADKTLDDMMARNNPALQATKDRIDAGYAKFKIVQAAGKAVGTHPDGTFTPAQLNRAVGARDRSKDKAAFARGDALMQDLSKAARDVLPQKVPDSGTPERLAIMHLLSGKLSALPGMAAGMLGGVAYSRPVSHVSNWIMNRLAQPPGANRQPIINAANALGRIGGPIVPPMAGSAMGSMVAPPPPQQ